MYLKRVSAHPTTAQASAEETVATQEEMVARIAAVVREALAKPDKADSAALSKVASQLRQIPRTVATDTQFEALQGVCRFFIAADRELAFAMEAAAYLIKTARYLDRKHALLNGLLIQSIIATQLDNYIEALESCASAREVAIDLAMPRGELIAVLNGAGVMINAGSYAEALDLLRQALTICDRCTEDADDVLANLLANISQCHLFLNNFSDGLEAIRAARSLSKEPADSHAAGIRTTIEYTHLRLLVASHRAAEAKPLLEAMAKYATQAGSVRAKIDYTVARGMIEVTEGQVDLGMSRIVVALEKAHLVPTTLADVLSAMVEAHRHVGNEVELQKRKAELAALLSGRQETSRLRAALLLGSSLGVGNSGQTSTTNDYDRRLDAAREKLLRSYS
jgi:tetratricopeptide (TPR) repeat protein